MKWFRVDNFYQSWSPIYRVTRFFSLATMTFNFEDKTADRTSTDQTLLVVGILMSLSAAYNVYEHQHERMLSATGSHIISGGMVATLFVFIVAQTGTLTVNYFNGHRIMRFPKMLESFDQQLKTHFGHCWNYQKDHFIGFMFIVINYVLWFMFTLLISPSSVGIPNVGWIQLLFFRVSMFWILLCYNTNGINLILVLLTIRKRFAVLNNVFGNYLKTTIHENASDFTTYPDCCRRQIRKFAILHDQLSDAVELFNYCFSIQAMLTLATVFSLTSFVVFGLIHSYAANEVGPSRQIAWKLFFNDGFYVLLIAQLVVSSSLLNLECKRASVNIHKAIAYGSYDEETIEEMRIFSQQLWHHAPKVFCGLFYFDWTLLYTMAGSLTTYLVILLQFDLVDLKYPGF